MRSLLVLLLLVCVAPAGADEMTPIDGPEDQVVVSTAFSYAGRLSLNGAAVNGTADLRFTLYDAATFGSTVGSQVYVPDVAIEDGLFTVALDFGAGVFIGDARWLRIDARAPHDPGNSLPMATLTPRQAITAVPYALHALNGGGGGGSGFWQLVGSSITNTGATRVFINRNNPITTSEYFGIHSPTPGYGGMYITTEDNTGIPFYGYRSGTGVAMWTYLDPASHDWVVYNNGNRLNVTSTGEVKLGTTLTLDDNDNTDLGGSLELRKNDGTLGAKLSGSTGAGSQGGALALYNDTSATATVVLDGEYGGAAGGALALRNSQGALTIELGADFNPGERGLIRMYTPAGTQTVQIDANEGGTADQGATIQLRDNAGNITIELDADYGAGGEGRVTAEVIEITGGADFSEQFDVTCAAADPGSVVSIDPASPGDLCLASTAYDRRVAGIISGAGGVKPGMLMGQRGTVANGQHPVALTGRVYCKVDAAYGAIEPGDMLTTSPTTGHAMKVTDHSRAIGAIVGKAMTSLEAGRGLVLVLVSLQ